MEGGKDAPPAKGHAAPRIERKIIEKNRRNRMKNLYSGLISLLPQHHYSTLEALPLPEQIDAAVDYIKSLGMKIDQIRVKREALTASSCITSENNQLTSCNTRTVPLVDVHHMGPNIDVILAHRLQDYSQFHQIIRVVNQNGHQISGASFTRHGNSTVQVLYDDKVYIGLLSRKLKEMMVCCRTTDSSEAVVEGSQLQISDYEIESNIWGFEIQ